MKKFLLILMICATAIGLYAQQPCFGMSKVTDHEGNVYNTVQIGDQCWTKENLRTTTSPSTGTYLIPAANADYTYTGKQARWYNNDASTYAPLNYGLLYNWNAAVDTFNTAYGETSVNSISSNAVYVTFTGHRRGICPAGWHLPSDEEWTTLEQSQTAMDVSNTGWRGDHAGKLAGGSSWSTSTTPKTPGNMNYSERNASGFSAVPAGYSYGSSFSNEGNGTTFWSTTHYTSYYAYYRHLSYSNADVSRNGVAKGNGCSVRCIRDIPVGSAPAGDAQSCPGTTTVTDHQGNVYNTVRIGNQCWMKQNMRATTSPSTGTNLLVESYDLTYTGKKVRSVNNTNDPTKYGLLYNWNAAVDTFNTAYGETSVNSTESNAVSMSNFTGHRRGICPVGWHLPTNAEWTALKDYLGSIPYYQCGGYSNYIAKALASNIDWNMVEEEECEVGYNVAQNNATGFSAVPAGDINGGFNYAARFWSFTPYEYHYGRAYSYYLHSRREDFTNEIQYKKDYKSVRCLRNNPIVSVSTTGIYNYNPTWVSCGGYVANTGTSITARGLCWSTNHNPTIADAHTSNGSGTGSFSANITGLTPSTTYYVRAYATPSQGATVYSDEVSFTTTACSDVNISITGDTYIRSGASTTLTASGASSYLWNNGSTNSSITVSPTVTTTYTVTGSNSCGNMGTATVTVVVTPACISCPDYDGVMDISGIGWSYLRDDTEVENGCRTYKIENVSSQYKYIFETGGAGSATFDTKLYLYDASCTQVAYNDDYSDYGTQSRVEYTPTNGSSCFIKVTGYSSQHGSFLLAAKKECATPLTITGDSVIRNGQSTTLTASGPGPYRWSNGSTSSSITVSPDATTTYSVYANDECGDSAMASVTVTVLPVCQTCPEYDASMYISKTGAWIYKSDSTEIEYGCRIYRVGVLLKQFKYTFETGGAGSADFDTYLYLYDDSCNLVASNDDYTGYGQQSRIEFTNTADGSYYLKVAGYGSSHGFFTLAVREDRLPVVSTNSVTNIGMETATCGGNITEEGVSAVTARGVCWSTNPRPTIADNHTSDGTGTGAFTSSITGLTSGTTYYVRAYATNSKGTAYGDAVRFSTLCSEDQCELTFVLTDNYGDGWNGNAIQVTDAETGAVLATLTNEDLDGLAGTGDDDDDDYEVKDVIYPNMETQTITIPICNGRAINFEWVSGSWSDETSYAVYDGQGEVIFSGSGGFTEPFSYTVTCENPCLAISLPYTENFDSFTQSTAAATGVEPDCWELVRTDAASMPDDKRPQLCYNSSFAHSGNYSLKMSNRCVYAMPELAEDVQVNKLRLDMFLRQANARYRLEVGIWDGQTFVPVATFDNGSTDVLAVSCDFSSYTGNGRRVAFRNSLNDGSNLAYSTNYLDDITLSLQLCEEITPPYTENFDNFTQSTAAATGVEPDCWELVRTDASSMPDDKRPQLCYNSSFAHSGNYSLKMSNRCVYAMPELAEDVQVNKLRLDMFLRQANARYRLEVGIWDGQTFVPVATFDNGSTDVLAVSCDFSSYTGNGRRVAFRNSLNDGSNLAYSTNYLDDITLSLQLCEEITPPYTENFDNFTQSTAAATGVEPDCWELVRTDAPSMPDDKRPQLCYNSSFAHSGSYSLKMSNRCVYAMPELAEDVQVNKLRLDMFLRQANARYRLEVGIWDGQTFVPVATFDNGSTDVLPVSCDFSSYTGNGRRVAFRNSLNDGSNLAYSTNYLDDITLSEQLCEKITPPYTENFDSFTQSTTAATGVEPDCWELVRTDAPSMPDDRRPQLYYKSDFAHSGSYSLKLNNRCVYAMPELAEDVTVSSLKLEMYLRQANAAYQLEVGVWDEATGSFEMVKRFNNASTDVEFVTCDFSNYTGNGRRIAFRNVLGSGSYAYSVNYIDDISLSEIVDCSISTLPYIETFEDFTESTTAATGVEPDCWELVRTDAPSMPDDKRPQIYYNSSFASSGNYTLKMGNRCVYAMPELGPNVPVNQISLDMYLRQPNAAYQLQVGVWDGQEFVPVATFNNSTTAVEHVTCDLSNYNGNGRRIAFRNTLGNGKIWDYSYNYIDDISLTRIDNNKGAEVTDANIGNAGMLGAARDLMDVIVYPNPTRDVVNVECTMNNVQLEGIEVIDVYGKVVRTVVETMCTSSLQTRINVSDLAAGMYFVRVTTNEGAVTKPFVKR